jgi:hypothetical protein
VGSRLEKLENGTYLLRLSKRCHRRSTKPPPVLSEKELVLVSSSSDSLKRYKRKPLSSEEVYNDTSTDRPSN